MTGFARSQGQADGGELDGKWTWELRSVNARSLDLRLRLPPGFDMIEPDCRKKIGAAFARGNITCGLQFEREGAGAVPVVNEAALAAILAALDSVGKRLGSPPPSAEAVLALRGVLEYGEDSPDDDRLAARNAAVLETLDGAISDLKRARLDEGAAIQPFLARQVDEIAALVERIRNDPSHTLAAQHEKLLAQLRPLIDANTGLDPQRLHQEAAILATKADISEEIDRLSAHVDAARELLGADGPVGRRLDFLSQEFNRECNTICSKSGSSTVTAAGLEMKAVIDRFREQVQNLE